MEPMAFKRSAVRSRLSPPKHEKGLFSTENKLFLAFFAGNILSRTIKFGMTFMRSHQLYPIIVNLVNKTKVKTTWRRPLKWIPPCCIIRSVVKDPSQYFQYARFHPMAKHRYLWYGVACTGLQDVQNIEVEGHITGGKAFCLKRIIEWVSGNRTAVHGKEYFFSVRRLSKAHKVTKPAFDTAALIIIASSALFIIFCSALKAIDIELPHIISDTVKILDQFAFYAGIPHNHHSPGSSYAWGVPP